jgi:hypothetical protein
MGLMVDYREISRPPNNGKGFSENPESTCHAFGLRFECSLKSIVIVSEEGVDLTVKSARCGPIFRGVSHGKRSTKVQQREQKA